MKNELQRHVDVYKQALHKLEELVRANIYKICEELEHVYLKFESHILHLNLCL